MKLDHPSLRILATGGEQLSSFHKTTYTLYNIYGPTENTVAGLSTIIKRPDYFPIGKPDGNIQVYLFDAYFELVPFGYVGEIFLGGAGLARGYLHRPDLTAEKFVPHPYGDGKRLYRTGDLGRWMPDGHMVFLGRADRQVKVRGFRVECGEIETVLLQNPAVKQAVVIMHRSRQALIAFVESHLSEQRLKNFLENHLPGYMIPSRIIPIQDIPLTPSQKVDRDKLLAHPLLTASDAKRTPPVTEMEKKLARIWREVLKRQKIYREDHFFDLGGHSLNLIEIGAGIRDELHQDIPITALLSNPLLKDQAFLLDRVHFIANLKNKPHPLIYNPKATKAIFCFPPALGYPLAYEELSKQLPRLRFICFPFVESKQLIQSYELQIKLIQPKGPFLLAGYSAGGSLAFQVGRYLESQGEYIERLVLFDSYRVQSPIEIQRIERAEQLNAYQDHPQFKAHLNPDVFRVHLLQRFQSFMEHLNRYPDNGSIQAPILLLKSEDNTLKDKENPWNLATQGEFLALQGFGGHYDLLNAEFCSLNTSLLKKFLDC